jgi:hypothetical protein
VGGLFLGQFLQPVMDGRFGEAEFGGDFAATQALECELGDLGEQGGSALAEAGQTGIAGSHGLGGARGWGWGGLQNAN